MAFLRRKAVAAPMRGLANVPELHSAMFPHQRATTEFLLRAGCGAGFLDTGLGKALIGFEWGRVISEHTNKPVLMLAPLAVSQQHVREGRKFDISVKAVRSPDDLQVGVNVCNYEMLKHFKPEMLGGLILDESSIIKHHDAKTLRILLEAFAQTPWKLCATATPAPNDYTELGTHAEFLGICSRPEMLSEFFTHDGGETQTWRLKKHARAEYWRWVASWAALVQKPSDLGYDDGGYALPPFAVHQHTMAADQQAVLDSGHLFAFEAQTLMERRAARKSSVGARVAAVAAQVAGDDEPWIVWCDLNAESEALVAAIPGAVEVRGSQDIDEKERRLRAFSAGQTRVMVTKPSIAGFGLNWQHCARVAFVGVTDSWEAYYQAVRRCWRFGQKQNVQVHIFSSEMEGAVVANLARKEADAATMSAELSAMTADAVRENVKGSQRSTNAYEPNQEMEIPQWLVSISPSPIDMPCIMATA